jgi:pre-mRNA-splicing factor 18
MRAGDAYLRLAVGKGQWVIGVAQVGIHDRAARERIRALRSASTNSPSPPLTPPPFLAPTDPGKIANVMNDETQRKYVTTIKRIMSWLQEAFPAADPSMRFAP